MESPTTGGSRSGEFAVKTEKLVRNFGDFRAVDGINLRVPRGVFFGFLGPNGAGKSTTIKMLTGVLAPSSGSAEILGFTHDSVEAKKKIGVVPEELALFDRLTGREYLEFVGRMYGMSLLTIRSRSDELLEIMGLADDSKKLIVDYSHGMQKKLALSAALIHDPQLLFLDEPFEGVDALAAKLMKSILGRLIERGVTIFLTSHVLEIVQGLCSEIAIIHQGKIVSSGSLDKLRKGADAEGSLSLEDLFLSVLGEEGRISGELSWLS